MRSARAIAPIASIALAATLALGITATGAASADAIDPGASTSMAAAATSHGSPWQTSGSSGCGTAPAIAPGTSATIAIASGGVERVAVVSVPSDYRADDPTPATLVFHGRGSTGALIQEFSGISQLPTIGIFPEGIATDGRRSWQGAPYAAAGVDDVAFTDALLDAVSADYCVDERRIFATGKSNGGGLVALLACRMSDRIAAFAPVAGAYYPGTAGGCESAGPAPILAFHGTADATMQYDGGVSHGAEYASVPAWLDGWAERNRCHASTTAPLTSDTTITTWRGCQHGAPLEHIAIDGGGHTWPGALAYSGGGVTTTTISATDTMWAFFLEHPLPHHR